MISLVDEEQEEVEESVRKGTRLLPCLSSEVTDLVGDVQRRGRRGSESMAFVPSPAPALVVGDEERSSCWGRNIEHSPLVDSDGCGCCLFCCILRSTPIASCRGGKKLTFQYTIHC